MKISDRLAALRLVLGGLLLFWLQLTLQLYRQIRDLGVIFSLTSQMWLLLFGLICLSGFGFALLLLTWTHHRRRMISLTSRFIQHLPAQKPVVIGLLLVLILAFSLFVLFPLGDFFNSAAFRWLLFGLIVTVVALLLRRTLPMANWLNILALALLIVGICYRVLQFLPDISLDPFSLNWSEASRYYYASLFFSEKIYGFAVPPSTLHPTRYWLQSLPFLLSTLPLWFHRAWQVFLWLACSLGAAWLLARRLKIASQTWLLLFLAWTFLFLWQGPVYYHLLVMIMLVLWGFDPRRFWRSLLIVALASAWAGVSRLNWFPVPGMLAATLYFLEKPFLLEAWKNGGDGLQPSKLPTFHIAVRYLAWPLIWVAAGTMVAFASQAAYIIWSGNAAEQFTSSFTSDLLWYRLFPNSTYFLGILTGTLLVSLPIFLLIGYRLRHEKIHWHPLTWLGLAAILGVLLLGGVVVSVKIGGGSNLHNLDAYLTALLVIGSYFYFRRATPVAGSESPHAQIPPGLNLLIVAIPVLFSMNSSSQFVPYHPQTAADSLLKMQRNIDRALEDGGEILFISERQLLTFDYLNGVQLVPEYEKVFLMEMVMAGNRNYLDTFQQEIHEQRFDLIITDPLFDTIKERGESWAEENNAWVVEVSQPILCSYWRKITFPESGVQILAPRDEPANCP